MHQLILKEGTTYPYHDPNDALRLARTFWPDMVTEFGPVVVNGQPVHRTLIWETPEAKAADTDGENVRAYLV